MKELCTMPDKSRCSCRKTLFLVAICLFCLSLSGPSIAQTFTPDELKLAGGKDLPDEISRFYALAGYRFLWLTEGPSATLENEVRRAGPMGLDPASYPFHPVGGPGRMDSLRAEIDHARTAFTFCRHLHSGAYRPFFKYEGLPYHPEERDFADALFQSVKQNRLHAFFKEMQPGNKTYQHALSLFGRLFESYSAPAFSDIVVKPERDDPGHSGLIKRLMQFGLWDEASAAGDSGYYRHCLEKTQKLFGLPLSGRLNQALRRALNKPIKERLDELSSLVNFLRWSDDLQKQEAVIFLNIPSADLFILRQDDTLLYSRVVVGKPSSPTPALSARIEDLILYPFWMVPQKIATRELLPLIQKDVAYIDRNNYQVLDRNGRIVDPRTVAWQQLTPQEFPYRLRQSTGCDNSLGLVKFDFRNPFDVYLHDSPAKSLFSKNKRFFSHGCMRVERAKALAYMLLGDNRRAMDTLTEKGCLLNQSPIKVKASMPLPLIVTYQTAWYDTAGEIIFYDDIYSRKKK